MDANPQTPSPTPPEGLEGKITGLKESLKRKMIERTAPYPEYGQDSEPYNRIWGEMVVETSRLLAEFPDKQKEIIEAAKEAVTAEKGTWMQMPNYELVVFEQQILEYSEKLRRLPRPDINV